MKLKITEAGMTYFPQDLREQGFIKEVEYTLGVHTVVLEKPGSTIKQIMSSLRNQMQSYRLKQETQGSTNVNKHGR